MNLSVADRWQPQTSCASVVGVGFRVEIAGRIKLRSDAESESLETLKRRFWDGDPIFPVDSLADLFILYAARASRQGDWITLEPILDGDPKMSFSTSAFYSALCEWVDDGRIDFNGETGNGDEGSSWSYMYSANGVSQVGENFYDDSTAPAPGYRE